MVNWDVVSKLMGAFPESFINHNGEFIAHRESNTYFILRSCETETDVKCKVLEWLSRAAYKTAPFKERKNRAFHKFMLDGINEFLGTAFSGGDMEQIYTYLGNAVDHEKTIQLIESGYDMGALKGAEHD